MSSAGAALRTLQGHTGYVLAVTTCTVGGRVVVVSGSYDKTVRVWDGAAGGAALLTLEGHTGIVYAVACHGVGEGGSAWRVVSGSIDKTVRVWDGSAGVLLHVYALDTPCRGLALALRLHGASQSLHCVLVKGKGTASLLMGSQ